MSSRSGEININEEHFENTKSVDDLWTQLKLEILEGGVDVLPNWSEPLESGATISLTSHVKLVVSDENGYDALSNYK